MLYLYSACGNIIGIISTPSTEFVPHSDFDQLILVNENNLTIYNQDGSLASQCGNGLRALAYHLNRPNNTFYINQKAYTTHYDAPYHWIALPYPQVEKKNQFGTDFYDVDIGNYHLILNQKDHRKRSLFQAQFPHHNISLIHREKQVIFIETYERGVGKTGACGSASCAAAYTQYLETQIKEWNVHNPKGTLITLIEDKILQTGEVTLLERINI